MAVTVSYQLKATVTETLPNNIDSAADASRVITHSSFDLSGTLNASSTPPATSVAEQLVPLVAGAKTIDLRALTGTNGASVDGNGLRVQIFRVKNTGANAMTFAKGASNGYDGFGSAFSLTVAPGAAVEIFGNDGGSDIGSTNKTIDVTGTSTQAFQLSVVMG